MTNNFWQQLDNLFSSSKIVIDRPRDSAHPRHPDIIYPMDYGYLDNTSAGDGDGIDVWIGSLPGQGTLVGAIATVDLFKRDVELKLLINCSEAEIQIIMDFYHDNQMGVHYLHREKQS
jgi:inorganic pyrophosphatase